jgi:hypothetical protein
MITPMEVISTLSVTSTTPAEFDITYVPRCGSVLGHINGLAEDGEWHCQLAEGHEGPCRAADGTAW